MPYMSRPLAAYADRRSVLSCYRAGYGVHLVAKMQVTMVSPVEVSGVVPTVYVASSLASVQSW